MAMLAACALLPRVAEGDACTQTPDRNRVEDTSGRVDRGEQRSHACLVRSSALRSMDMNGANKMKKDRVAQI